MTELSRPSPSGRRRCSRWARRTIPFAAVTLLLAACAPQDDPTTQEAPTMSEDDAAETPGTGVPATAPPHATPTAPPDPRPTGTATPEGDPGELPPGTDDPVSDEPPGLVTEMDDGATVTLAPGEEVPLRLDNSWEWEEPRIEGDAVTLAQVDYFQDPGYREWNVVAMGPGEAVLTAAGEPACGDAAACPPVELTLTFVVEG